MKFITAFAVLTTLTTAVSAISPDGLSTNAKRLASGLTPFPPIRRGNRTPTYGGKRSQPSGVSNVCNTGSLQCCESVGPATDPQASLLAMLLNVPLDPNDIVGVDCTPGTSIASCPVQPACCVDNDLGGVLALGCSPVND